MDHSRGEADVALIRRDVSFADRIFSNAHAHGANVFGVHTNIVASVRKRALPSL